ncbi:MAG: hypothetical protein JWQ25_1350 [Daejeonella sp.]|nr:hypothetical protein [Daejeonella sp.]
MVSLSANWFIEGSIDFEHKKYLLLSYLKQINQSFHSTELYPDLTDLIFHYNNLVKFKKDKTVIQKAFPQRLTKADMEKMALTYEKMVQDDALMQEIEQIISYALSKMNPALQEGKEIYEFVQSRINIETIGVVPLFPYRGYMLLRNGDDKATHVYEYQVTIFESNFEKQSGISTTFVDRYVRSLIYTPEAIRKDLIHSRNSIMPNPAVYHIESDISFPLEKTFLPLAKRSLVRYLAGVA